MAGNFFESKFMQKLQVGGQKIAANKGVSAIIAAMMSMMAVILSARRSRSWRRSPT